MRPGFATLGTRHAQVAQVHLSELSSVNDVVIGIDLGTSNSCVAVMGEQGPAVLANSKGELVHPSIVSFLPEGPVVVGNAAKRYLSTAPERTISSAKRLMGRHFFSEAVKRAVERSAYTIVEGPQHSVLLDVGGMQLTPQDIAAFVLKEMRRVAEVALGRPVQKAVVTVPAYFNDNQRQATKDAGRIAGLDVIRMINEPTAAALAYGYGRDLTQRVAIYDLGGGTFDVSVLEIGRDIFEVLGTAGDTFLGGDDFDERIAAHLATTFMNQMGIDVRPYKNAMARIKTASEGAKRLLSEKTETAVRIPQLLTDKHGMPLDLETKLQRNEVARMTMDLLQRTFKVCDEALQAARMRASDLDGVILVGGPTRLPFVRDAVAHYFGQPPNVEMDPDQVVAIGAALHGHALTHPAAAGTDAMLLDVTPLTLRLGTVGGFTEEIVEKNTAIPTERTRTFTTARDNQDRVLVRVFQGESRLSDECTQLGEFEFNGLSPAPRGQLAIEVTFEIDASGMVHVSALEKQTGKKAKSTIRLSGSLTEADLAKRKAEHDATALAPMEVV